MNGLRAKSKKRPVSSKIIFKIDDDENQDSNCLPSVEDIDKPLNLPGTNYANYLENKVKRTRAKIIKGRKETADQLRKIAGGAKPTPQHNRSQMPPRPKKERKLSVDNS